MVSLINVTGIYSNPTPASSLTIAVRVNSLEYSVESISEGKSL